MNHHNVYVVLLDSEAARIKRRIALYGGRLGAVYVGATGLTPEERYGEHKRGYKQNTLVMNHGVRLLSHLYKQYNPMTHEHSVRAEAALALALRARGYCVISK